MLTECYVLWLGLPVHMRHAHNLQWHNGAELSWTRTSGFWCKERSATEINAVSKWEGFHWRRWRWGFTLEFILLILSLAILHRFRINVDLPVKDRMYLIDWYQSISGTVRFNLYVSKVSLSKKSSPLFAYIFLKLYFSLCQIYEILM